MTVVYLAKIAYAATSVGFFVTTFVQSLRQRHGIPISFLIGLIACMVWPLMGLMMMITRLPVRRKRFRIRRG